MPKALFGEISASLRMPSMRALGRDTRAERFGVVEEGVEVVHLDAHVLDALAALLDVLGDERLRRRAFEHRDQRFAHQEVGDDVLLLDVFLLTEIPRAVDGLEPVRDSAMDLTAIAM